MYAVLCFDQPRAPKLRDENRERHMAYLNDNVNKIVFAGPLKDDSGAASTGAIFILNVETREEAEAFLHGDAFYIGGVYESTIIRPFRQVFPSG